MPEPDAPLEEVLEAAEALLAPPRFSPRTLIIALFAMSVLLTVVSVTLAVASGGSLGQETRLLAMVVPQRVTPESYRSRVRITDTEARFVKTPYGTQEIHVSGLVENHGNRVLARADVQIRIVHLFRETTYAYTFSPVTPTAEGISEPGPLLAGGVRAFRYRIPEFPADVEKRDVRIHWDVQHVEFHHGLPIPMQLPQPGP